MVAVADVTGSHWLSLALYVKNILSACDAIDVLSRVWWCFTLTLCYLEHSKLLELVLMKILPKFLWLSNWLWLYLIPIRQFFTFVMLRNDLHCIHGEVTDSHYFTLSLMIKYNFKSVQWHWDSKQINQIWWMFLNFLICSKNVLMM